MRTDRKRSLLWRNPNRILSIELCDGHLVGVLFHASSLGQYSELQFVPSLQIPDLGCEPLVFVRSEQKHFAMSCRNRARLQSRISDRKRTARPRGTEQF